MKVNLNDMVKVKLTPRGRRTFLSSVYRPTIDLSSDEIEIQLWRFCRIFGPAMSMGSRAAVEDNQIEIVESSSE